MQTLAESICYAVHTEDRQFPLLVLSLPDEECDFDQLLPEIIKIVRTNARTTKHEGHYALEYELLIFCAGTCRPSWPWLIHNLSKLNKRLRKGLQKLYLVHEKSWIRVCMQLMENIVSPKFARKIRHIRSLAQLAQELGPLMQHIDVPEAARAHDMLLMQDDSHSRRHRKQFARDSDKRRTDTHDNGDIKQVGTEQQIDQRIRVARSDMRCEVNVRRQPRASPPEVPAKRSTLGRTISTEKVSTESLIIFEDPEDEPSAARAAAALQDLLLGNERKAATENHSQLFHSSASAPTVNQQQPRQLGSLKSASGRANPANALRRATSGPLTPSRSLQQNYLPSTDMALSPPKLVIRGKEVTVKLKKGLPDEVSGRVGGLKALFEQKAMVARQLS